MATFNIMLSVRTSSLKPESSFTSFLYFPREIRTIIYSYIVHDLILILNEPLPKTPKTAILRCNRQICQEAIQLIHFRVTRQDFYDLILAVPRTLSRLSHLHDLTQIRNLVFTSFEVNNKLLYNTSHPKSQAPHPPTSLPYLRRVQVELELCSCGPTHYCIRRRSCAQVQCGQETDTDQHGDDSYAAKLVSRNRDKLAEQVRWMRNVEGYEVEIKLVLMDNKGQESLRWVQNLRKVGQISSDQSCSSFRVAVLMITRAGVEIVEDGEDNVAGEARGLVVEYLGSGNLAKI